MSNKGRAYRTIDVDGWQVLVGRGAEENEYLSLEVAEKQDMWLHAGGGSPGSHVVIRNPDQATIPDEIVEKAAQLAAWYSKSRGAPVAKVDVCRACDVSKRKGSPLGQVEIRRHRTLKVKPERVGSGEE